MADICLKFLNKNWGGKLFGNLMIVLFIGIEIINVNIKCVGEKY
jgi:hypothetical protein